MRTTKIITITLLLATLFVGCKKENNGRIMIVADRFASDNSKVAIDPNDIPTQGSGSHAEWVLGEEINLNGTPYAITQDASSNGYYLNVAPDPSNDMYAIYPGSSFGGNDVEVTYNPSGTSEVVLNRLVARFRDDYRQEIVFPMSSHVGPGVAKMPFRHLTGGFRINMLNSTTGDVKVASLKVVAKSENPVTHLDYDYSGFNVTARWAVQGPAVPNSGIGDNDQDVNVKYTSEMYFDVRHENTPTDDGYVVIVDGEHFSICVPVTISWVRYLTIIGYNDQGTECFRATKDLGTEIEVKRNKMYNLPEIEILP